MQIIGDRTLDDSNESTKQEIKDFAAKLILGEAALMFSGLFLVMAAFWFHVFFHVLTTACAVAVLRIAYQAAQTIPASIPFQRPMGVVFYILPHLMRAIFPGELPIELVALWLFTYPLAFLFLFE